MAKILVQTTIEATERNTSAVYFNVYKDSNDAGTQYSILHNFNFRGYDMTTIGECDFYDVTQEELNSIIEASNAV